MRIIKALAIMLLISYPLAWADEPSQDVTEQEESCCAADEQEESCCNGEEEFEEVCSSEECELLLTDDAYEDDESDSMTNHLTEMIQSFFDIIQNPEENSGVIDQLMGMLSGMMQAAMEAIRDGKIDLSQHVGMLQQVMQKLDPQTREKFQQITLISAQRINDLQKEKLERRK